MGGSSDQVTGYKYVTNFLLFIGNPIEKVLGINFDKRGWLTPLIDEMKNPLSVGVVEKPTLYGENEGGVVGQIYAKYGTDNQQVVPFYKDYMESKELSASAYPFQSYLAFKEFYVGNSGYMKEMLLWPKRIHVRNDGRAQWYDEKSEIPEIGNDGKPSCFMIAGAVGNPEVSITGDFIENFSGLFVWGRIFGVNISRSATIKFVIKYSSSKNTEMNIPQVKSSSHKVSISSNSNLSVTNLETGDGSWSKSIVALLKKGIDMAFEITFSVDFDAKVGAENSFFMNSNRPNVHSGYYCDSLDAPDINPIHKIREILTDDTAMNKPESSVNDSNFMKAADQIWDECLGISWSITEKSCIDAINELCYHIEAGIRVNRQTGLYEMVLFRDNWFEEDEIHAISESKIKSMQYEITNADEVINQVNVNYYDRENIKNSSFSISENGLIQTLGRVNAETLDFPYFMNMRNAEVVANWKLKQLSTGAFKGSFTTGWREARKWNRYDLIRLPWSKRWTGTILVRIMSINLGGPTNNEVSIEYIEVVPSTGMMNTSIVADEPIDKPLPPQACEYEPFEMPYYLAVMALGQRQVDEELAYDSNFGLVGVVAEKPQENSLYAVMMTNNYDEWVRAGSIQYSLTADSDQIISKTTTSFTVKNWKKISNVLVGTLIQCGKEWLTGSVEWMVFQGVDLDTGIVSVKRGALDTQPKDWDLGLKLYFCGTDISYDQTEYVADEKVLVSALTTTPSGVLEQKGSNLVVMKARAIRPYPPANVKINSEYWPESITGDLELTWSDRNRLQQTGGEILGWYDSGVTLENGVTYNAEIYDAASNIKHDERLGLTTNTVTFSGVDAPALARLDLYSVRDSFESYQKYQHIFSWGEPPETFITAFIVNGTFTVPQNISAIDVLIVAGGGGGGSRQGGGGGAGGIIVLSNHSVTPGDSIPIIVGDGGAGGINGGPGTDGKNSIFGTVVATGGGGGGGRTTENNGRVGGSGGGSHLGAPGEATGLQGNKGGTGFKGNKGGGGGGGAGAGQDNLRPDGSNASSGEADYLSDAGDGGDGLFFPNLAGYGENGYFAGGGGGGGFNTASGAGEGAGGAGKGGAGGGGGGSAGSDSPAIIGGPGHDAMPNTGGGGGGSAAGNFAGGAGGSGIVIIVYPAGQLQPIISAKTAVSEIL